jgi:type I restriction enzyme M protein
MIKWWNKRKKSDVAWKVKVEDLKRGFDLDVKNPNRAEDEEALSTSELLTCLKDSLLRSQELVNKLAREIS